MPDPIPTPPVATPPVPGPPAATPPAVDPPPATPPVDPPKVDPPVTDPPKANPWDDPKVAQAEIEKLRRENGASRTNAKEAAATEARNELAQSIGKAIGLVQDEPIDPAKLTESLTSSQAETKQARVELAVFRNAITAGGDPAALLDSTSFLKSLDGIDPSDGAAVQAAITAAVGTNQRLGAATSETPPTRVPAPNPAQGTGGDGAPTGVAQLSETDVKRLYEQGKYEEISTARSEGRLSDYLGS